MDPSQASQRPPPSSRRGNLQPKAGPPRSLAAAMRENLGVSVPGLPNRAGSVGAKSGGGRVGPEGTAHNALSGAPPFVTTPTQPLVQTATSAQSDTETDETHDFPTPTPKHRVLWGTELDRNQGVTVESASSTNSRPVKMPTSSIYDTRPTNTSEVTRVNVQPRGSGRWNVPHTSGAGSLSVQVPSPANPRRFSGSSSSQEPPASSSSSEPYSANSYPISLSDGDLSRTSLDSSGGGQTDRSVITRSDVDEDSPGALEAPVLYNKLYKAEQSEAAQPRRLSSESAPGHSSALDRAPSPSLQQGHVIQPPSPYDGRARGDPLSPARIAVVAHQQRSYAPGSGQITEHGAPPDEREHTAFTTPPSSGRTGLSGPTGLASAAPTAPAGMSLKDLLSTVSEADVKAAAQVAASWHLGRETSGQPGLTSPPVSRRSTSSNSGSSIGISTPKPGTSSERGSDLTANYESTMERMPAKRGPDSDANSWRTSLHPPSFVSSGASTPESGSRPPSVRFSPPTSLASSPSKPNARAPSPSLAVPDSSQADPAKFSKSNESQPLDPASAFEQLLSRLPAPSAETLSRSSRTKAHLARRYELVATMMEPGGPGFNPLKVTRWRQESGRWGKTKDVWSVGTDELREWWDEVGAKQDAKQSEVEHDDSFGFESHGENPLKHIGSVGDSPSRPARVRVEELTSLGREAPQTGFGVNFSFPVPSSPTSPQATVERRISYEGTVPPTVTSGALTSSSRVGDSETLAEASQSALFQKFLSGALQGQASSQPQAPTAMATTTVKSPVTPTANGPENTTPNTLLKPELRKVPTDTPVPTSTTSFSSSAIRPAIERSDDPRHRKRSVSTDSASARAQDRRSKLNTALPADSSKMKRIESVGNSSDNEPASTNASSRGSLEILGGMWQKGRMSPTPVGNPRAAFGNGDSQAGFFGGLFGRRRTRRGDGHGSDGGSALALMTTAADMDPEFVNGTDQGPALVPNTDRESSPVRLEPTPRRPILETFGSAAATSVISRRSASVSGTGPWRLVDFSAGFEGIPLVGKPKDRDAVVGRPPSIPLKVNEGVIGTEIQRNTSAKGGINLGSPLSVVQANAGSSGSVDTISSTSPTPSLRRENQESIASQLPSSVSPYHDLVPPRDVGSPGANRSSSEVAVNGPKSEAQTPPKQISANSLEQDAPSRHSLDEARTGAVESERDSRRGRKEKRRDRRTGKDVLSGVGLMVTRPKSTWIGGRKREKGAETESRARSSSRESASGSAFSKTKGRVVQGFQKARNALLSNRGAFHEDSSPPGDEQQEEQEMVIVSEKFADDGSSVGATGSSSLKRASGRMSLTTESRRLVFTSEMQAFLRELHSPYRNTTPPLIDTTIVLTPHADTQHGYANFRLVLEEFAREVPVFTSRLQSLRARMEDFQTKDLEALTRNAISDYPELPTLPPSARSDSGSAMNISSGIPVEPFTLGATRVIDFGSRAERTDSGSVELQSPNQSTGRNPGVAYWTPSTSLQRNSEPTLVTGKFSFRDLQEVYQLVVGVPETRDAVSGLSTSIDVTVRELARRAEELQRKHSSTDYDMSRMINRVEEITTLVNERWLVRLKEADDEFRKVQTLRGPTLSDWMWALLGVVLTFIGSTWYYGYIVYKKMSVVLKDGTQAARDMLSRNRPQQSTDSVPHPEDTIPGALEMNAPSFEGT
ncbi:hypothetical protein M427DRAFT_51155 [Gonapodya prolifera JEL478]|uniref:Uncharacterized protein n=1 Tax=Gonapodya prolifera (strain JEL478) TaxID=1344416 RepID=A0A139AZ74_GONPJ|nr:hypothetical protein M427DRAFT_51155 [Gonapodya prolifera JEL478]|eukprot:KXS21775.1 hypothetical protein M427DRAFT_51155 [Gonapodya prolifera JEL478]